MQAHHSADSSFIPKYGGYKNLLSYRKALIVYEATVFFSEHYIDRRSRTRDQMVQAARSGKQNIVEGCMASATSRESEIKLINVARASLEELLEDYCDFLRSQDAAQWQKNSREALYVRQLGSKPGATYDTFKPFLTTRPAVTAANIIICLIHQTNFLLDKQIRRLEQDFISKGGLRENMSRARKRFFSESRENR